MSAFNMIHQTITRFSEKNLFQDGKTPTQSIDQKLLDGHYENAVEVTSQFTDSEDNIPSNQQESFGKKKIEDKFIFIYFHLKYVQFENFVPKPFQELFPLNHKSLQTITAEQVRSHSQVIEVDANEIIGGATIMAPLRPT
jgi:hypothetical protein